jgi:dTDP-L-rhamnose 4-epimerase
VTVFDNLTSEVHGTSALHPAYMNQETTFVRGDVRDRNGLGKVIRTADVILHLAALTGVGQSMLEVPRYVETNVLGTANLLDILANSRHHVRKLIVASSRAVYGEGQYVCQSCGIVFPEFRSRRQLEKRRWGVGCPHCGEAVTPTATDEGKPLKPGSVYAVTKRDQEEMCLSVSNASGIPVVVLRYFNVYGPRQSLSNPYTGVVSIFASHILRGRPPEIYEDGLESRDFVHVSDAVRATLLAMESDRAEGQSLNVGTGRRLSILKVANILMSKMNCNLVPEFTGRFRAGDVRHCYADVTKARRVLGFNAEIEFEEGTEDFLRWVYDECHQLSGLS